MERYRSWLALKQVPGIGNILFRRLIDRFSTPESVFQAGENALLKVEGVTREVTREIRLFKGFDALDQELAKIEKAGISLLTLGDADYPKRLREIYDPPPLLYLKGQWKEEPLYPVAVVGARKTSQYGRMVTERLCRGLVRQGATVVSGFARGIDGLAHRSTLSEGGKTIAVLGCGIDMIYPTEHKKLYDEVVESGVIFSEFAMGVLPQPHHFPQRNRIISGLSLGCVVVEATLKSGSLITARLALEQGREVFAVPGPILSETSAGPHRLIASGAKLVHDVSDITGELLPLLETRDPVLPIAMPPLEADEDALYQLLSSEPKHVDQVIHESEKAVPLVSGLLLSLELKGVIKQLAGQFYVRL